MRRTSDGRHRDRSHRVAPCRRRTTTGKVFFLVVLGALLVSTGADARRRSGRESAVARQAREAPGASLPVSEILIDADGGGILFALEPHLRRPPASTVKTMLELVVMQMIWDGQAKLTDSVRVSARASKVGGSQVFLKEGEVFALQDLMKSIVIASANDACVAVAEHLAGSVEGFVQLMNDRAAEMGLKDSHFVNVHGLDEERLEDGNLTSAYDLSRIALELVRHPEVLEWSSTREAPFRDGRFILRNTNKLIGQFSGMDGLKTGYTSNAGFCLVATAARDNLRLISVVMGLPTERSRFEETSRLLGATFATYKKVVFARKGAEIGKVRVEAGVAESTSAVAASDISSVIRRGNEKRLRMTLDPMASIEAPISKGDTLGTARISLGDSILARVAIVAQQDVPRAGLVERILRLMR